VTSNHGYCWLLCAQEVCERVWETLYDYPSLRTCAGLLHYIDECVRLAWALTLQNPPLVVDYESRHFDPSMHVRFHTSDPDSTDIKCVLWPMLTEGDGGVCVYRGVVITWHRDQPAPYPSCLVTMSYCHCQQLSMLLWTYWTLCVMADHSISVLLHMHWIFHVSIRGDHVAGNVGEKILSGKSCIHTGI